MNLKAVVQKLVVETNLNQPAPLGGKSKVLSYEERKLFISSLDKAAKWNGALAIGVITAAGVLLGFCLWMALQIKSDPSKFEPILGGSLLGFIPLILIFADVWKEKHRMDILRAILPLITLEKLTELAFAFASGDLESLTETNE